MQYETTLHQQKYLKIDLESIYIHLIMKNEVDKALKIKLNTIIQ